MFKLIVLVVCLSSLNCWSQTFSKDYAREFSGANDAPADGKTEHLKKIFQLKGIDIDKVTEFVISEEQCMDFSLDSSFVLYGVVSTGNQTFTYSFRDDLPNVRPADYFLKDYNNLDPDNARSIVYFLTKNKQTDKIEKLAVNEMNNGRAGVLHKWQYEVIAYDAKTAKKIRMSYLHETVTKVYH